MSSADIGVVLQANIVIEISWCASRFTLSTGQFRFLCCCIDTIHV